jgi:hypothetical protein
MTTTTLDSVPPAGSGAQEAATRPDVYEPPVGSEPVATWSAGTRTNAAWSVQARPTLALQRRLIAGLVG